MTGFRDNDDEFLTCGLCGRTSPDSFFDTCEECGRTVCSHCYDPLFRGCAQCVDEAKEMFRARRAGGQAKALGMSESRLGELQAYCYMVSRGKPVACLAVKSDESKEALEEILRHGLRGHIDDLGHGWKTVWVYKRPLMAYLIEKAPTGDDIVCHWYWGKMFGYSDEEIERFLKDAGFDFETGGSASSVRGDER